jgi:hypothetical protein
VVELVGPAGQPPPDVPAAAVRRPTARPGDRATPPPALLRPGRCGGRISRLTAAGPAPVSPTTRSSRHDTSRRESTFFRDLGLDPHVT